MELPPVAVAGRTRQNALMSKVKRISHLLVGDFFRKHGTHLKLELISEDAGLNRKIFEPSVNRPGLALAGFYLYFAYKRIQVLGNSEFAYLGSLPEREQAKRFEEMGA